MIRLLTFLALVASASASGTCKVGYNGQCSSFNGQNIKQAFPSNCYVPLATGACGSDSWLIFFSTFTMTFNVRYEGFIYTIDNGTTFSRTEFSIALNLAGTVATITATTVPSNTCGLCNNNGNPQCLSPITTTPLPTTTTTEEITTVAVTSAPPSECKVFTSGLCTGFNGCNSTTTFPPNDNILLAMGACEGETWVVFYSTITMSFSIKFEGFIYPCNAGNVTKYGSVSVEVNIEMTMAIILVDDLPSGLTCGLCSSSGSAECSGTLPISSTPALITTEEPTTTEEATTSVSVPPVATCTVSTGGHCTGFDGCKSTTSFPSNTEIVLAKGDCEAEDTWIVFYSTITMSFNIRFEGFIYPCNPGNKTVFGSVSVEVNIEMTLAVILVADMPTGITCGLCGSSENVECESTALPPSEAPATPEKTTEGATTVVSTSEVPDEESTCIVYTGGECTGFNGCKSVTTFPPNTEIVLAKGDCEAEDTWIVFYSTITMSFNIKFEGFIYPCHGGNKTVFGSVSVEVNIEMTMAIILVDNMPSGNCGLCGSESVGCAASTAEAVISSEAPTTTEESTTFIATSEASSEIPPSTCIVSTGGECTGFNGCSSKTTFPENTEIVLAKGDCEAEDTWVVFYSTITMSFNIKFEGFIHSCNPGNKTVFGAVSVEVNIEMTMAIILVADLPSGIDCGVCGSESAECSSASTELPSTPEEMTTTEEVTTSFATSEASSELPPSTCIVSTGGECTGFNGCSSTTTFPENTEIVLAKGDCEAEDTWIVFYSTITMSFNIKFEGFIYPCNPGNKTVFGAVSVEVNIEVTMAIILVADMPAGIDCGVCGSETVECSSSSPALTSTEEPSSSVATTEEGDCGCAEFCTVSISGGSISFDGSEFEGDYPEDCILPLASSDCGDDKKWQILLSKATSSFFLVVDGEIIVLGFGSIYVKYEMTVFVTYQTVFVVLPGKSLENDCSVCGKPDYKECIEFPGLPSTPYPWVTKAPSTIPPCVFPSSLTP